MGSPPSFKLDKYRFPWNQLPDETDTAYRAFTIYLNLEGKRTYSKVARELGVSPQNIKMWGVRYNWRGRARDYDNWLVGQQTEAKIAAAAQRQSRVINDETQDYARLLEVWGVAVDAFLNNVSSIDITEIAGQMRKLVETRLILSDLGRRAAELPRVYKEKAPVDVDQLHVITFEGPKAVAKIVDAAESEDEAEAEGDTLVEIGFVDSSDEPPAAEDEDGVDVED